MEEGMGLRINTNVPSLVAQRNLRSTRGLLDRTLERLSSGSRINHAGDDAAGLAISETLRANIRGLGQAERNAHDGISLVQVAEGGLVEISNILIRMRELGVQASSDTVGTRERKFLDNEFQQLSAEIERIANSIEFNGNPLLNGSGNAFEVQIGVKNNPLVDRITLFDPYKSNVNLVSLGINLSNLADKASAQSSLASLDSALNSVTSTRAEFGSMQNRLQSVTNNLSVNKENMMTANSRIRDADLAEETSELTKAQVLQQAGISVLAQANQSMKAALGLIGGQA